MLIFADVLHTLIAITPNVNVDTTEDIHMLGVLQ